MEATSPQQPNSYFVVREVRPQDVSFIFNSWLHSYRESPTARNIAKTDYYRGQHALIERLLKSPQCRIFVACAPDDSDQILGYIVWEQSSIGPVIHWVYTKLPLRGFKLASTLYDMVRIQCTGTVYFTHLPKLADRLLSGRQVHYNPFLAWI